MKNTIKYTSIILLSILLLAVSTPIHAESNDIEKKSYYDNDSWIKNRAIQALSSGSGIYMDVYAN